MGVDGVGQSPLPSETIHYEGKFLAAKQRKQQTEYDALVLANRIALLKKEESKAWKKIEETKKRGDEIIRLRENNEQRLQEKVQLAERLAAQQRASQAKNMAVEEGMRKKRMEMVEELKDRKRDGVAAVRQEKQQWRQELQDYRASKLEENQKRRADIKAHEGGLRQRRESERAKLIEENRKAYEQKVQAEVEEVKKKEVEVVKMEKLENKLIEQLKTAQIMQQKAYVELKTTLSVSTVRDSASATTEAPLTSSSARSHTPPSHPNHRSPSPHHGPKSEPKSVSPKSPPGPRRRSGDPRYPSYKPPSMESANGAEYIYKKQQDLKNRRLRKEAKDAAAARNEHVEENSPVGEPKAAEQDSSQQNGVPERRKSDRHEDNSIDIEKSQLLGATEPPQSNDNGDAELSKTDSPAESKAESFSQSVDNEVSPKDT